VAGVVIGFPLGGGAWLGGVEVKVEVKVRVKVRVETKG